MNISDLRRRRAIEQLIDSGQCRTVDWVTEIDSTNSEQKRRATDGELPALPWLLVADRQTTGRGRGGNTWWSPDGCLMFSLMLRFDGDALGKISQLPLVIGVSLAKSIRKLAAVPDSICVKWPNDLFAGEKKLAGILIESFVGNGSPVWIVGVGINILVPIQDADESVRRRATSLHLEASSSSQSSLSVETVLIELVDDFFESLDEWERNEDWLHEHWDDYSFLDGKRVGVVQHNQTLRGHCLGVDENGALIIDDERSGRLAVLSGVVESWED